METPAQLGSECSDSDPKRAVQQKFLCRRSFHPSDAVRHLEVVKTSQLDCWARHHCRAHHPSRRACLSVLIIFWRVTWVSGGLGEVFSLRKVFKQAPKRVWNLTEVHSNPNLSMLVYFPSSMPFFYHVRVLLGLFKKHFHQLQRLSKPEYFHLLLGDWKGKVQEM